MKDLVFLLSPIYPPFISANTSPSTNRDDHLISLLSHDDFTFKAQLTSLYMHPTDYSIRFYDENQDFFTSIASKIMGLLNNIPHFLNIPLQTHIRMTI